MESVNGGPGTSSSPGRSFDSVLEARVLYEDWRHTYNLHRPRSSLGFQPFAVFAAAFSNQKP
ncbi:MAG: integrase core domain-containing protein [Candidatus Dormibacteria bacterium]